MGENGRGQRSIHTIAMLGNHLPRHCGIATFTTDLSDAIGREMPELECFVLAMKQSRAIDRQLNPQDARGTGSMADRTGFG